MPLAVDDWFLPSRDELNIMYNARFAIGGFQSTWYWSSSQNNQNTYSAWIHNFNNGSQYLNYKSNFRRVRAIRAF